MGSKLNTKLIRLYDDLRHSHHELTVIELALRQTTVKSLKDEELRSLEWSVAQIVDNQRDLREGLYEVIDWLRRADEASLSSLDRYEDEAVNAWIAPREETDCTETSPDEDAEDPPEH